MKTALMFTVGSFNSHSQNKVEVPQQLSTSCSFRKPWFSYQYPHGSSKGPDTFLLAPQALHICGTQPFTQADIHKHKKIKRPRSTAEYSALTYEFSGSGRQRQDYSDFRTTWATKTLSQSYSPQTQSTKQKGYVRIQSWGTYFNSQHWERLSRDSGVCVTQGDAVRHCLKISKVSTVSETFL